MKKISSNGTHSYTAYADEVNCFYVVQVHILYFFINFKTSSAITRAESLYAIL